MESKLLFSLICFFSVLLLSLGFSASAYAEFYVVSGMGTECFSTCCHHSCRPCVHRMRFVSPHRRNPSGEGQVAEYEWVGDP